MTHPRERADPPAASKQAQYVAPRYVAPVDVAPIVDDAAPVAHRAAPSFNQVAILVGAVSVLVGGLLVGLPGREVAGGVAPTFAPLAPRPTSGRAQGDLPLDVAFQLQFTKPMNEASVENALTISPQVNVRFQWDATGQILAVVPNSHWEPHTNYAVDISGAASDKQGLGLASEIHTSFESGAPTSGEIIATKISGDLVSPATAFQVTFTRPVKLFTVMAHFRLIPQAVCPEVNGVSSAPVNGTCPAAPVDTASADASSSPSAAPASSPSAAPASSPSPSPTNSPASGTPTCPAVEGVGSALVDGACPLVPVDIVGDDPTDIASQVFTITPKAQLESRTVYIVSMDVGDGKQAAGDAAGAALQVVSTVKVTTMSAPEVAKSAPQDGAVSYDTNQPISVRFTMAMDTKASTAALSVTVDGVAVAGTRKWSEGNTVLVLTPKHSIKIGSTVIVSVSKAARSTDGLHLAKALSTKFTIKKRPPRPIQYFGRAVAGSPWYGAELYYLKLMNCTRTGGWVTSNGACSDVTHHTLPRQNALSLSAGISNKVSRPYAQYMANNRLLDHFLKGTNPHTRLCNWGGYCGNSYGENIASPPNYNSAGMIQIETFYQKEYWEDCPNHYCNIMNRHFTEVGIGVWWSSTAHAVRVSIDFYG